MDAMQAWQEEHTARVADLVMLQPVLAAIVLRQFRWSTAAVEGFFSYSPLLMISTIVSILGFLSRMNLSPTSITVSHRVLGMV
jgi:type III secretory pathway component EscR